MKLTLINKETEVPGVESFIFQPSEPLVWKAGQYLHYKLPHEPVDDRGAERWFTAASAPFEKNVMITTRIATEKGSTFKSALNALAIGGSMESDYVDGDFTIDDPTREYVFLAGGIGITPFHSILKEADNAGVKINETLIYANRDANVVFKDELEAWAAHNPNLTVRYLTSPERIDEQAVRALVPELQKPLFYISGPEPMVKSLGTTLEGMGVPPEHIKLDDFPGYPAD